MSDTLVVLGSISKSGSGTTTQSASKIVDLYGKKVAYGYVSENHGGYTHGNGKAGGSITITFSDNTTTTLVSKSDEGNTPRSSSSSGYVTAEQQSKGIVSATLIAYGGGTNDWDHGGGYGTGSAMLYGYESNWVTE